MTTGARVDAASAPRFALITGASAGIGKAAAEELLRRGWEVAGIARREVAIAHARYRHLRGDVGDLAALEALVEREVAPALRDPRWRRVALVNNAADGGHLGRFEDASIASLERVFAVNVVAPVRLMGWFLREVPPATPLRLLGVTSGVGSRAFPGLSGYGAGKAALMHASRILAAELDSAERGRPPRPETTVIIYDPGPVETGMQVDARSRSLEEFPWVGFFLGMRDRGILAPPDRVGADLAAVLEEDQPERYTHTGFRERHPPAT